MRISTRATELHFSIAVVLLAALLAGCVSSPMPTAAPQAAAQPTVPPAASTAVPTATPASTATAIPPTIQAATAAKASAVTPAVIPTGWKVYSNTEGFAISYPAGWKTEALPDTYEGQIHAQALNGAEGEVDLSWGKGFGGACPPGYIVVEIAQGTINACYAKKTDGSETWTQMSHALPNAGFQAQAGTADAALASHDTILQILSTLTFQPAPVQTPVATYADPFAYCAAIGAIDSPDARYSGPKTPNSVLPVPVGQGTPSPFPEGSVYWRCMDGSVYSCAVGANIPCWSKANTSTEPTEGMLNYCKDQPNADIIPAFAAGHDAIYAWSCEDGKPVMGKQVLQVDAQGYPGEYWTQVSNPAATPAASGIANPASQNCVKQGGKLVIETRPDGGQYGVCYFVDNLQCEEWALLRGECPVGGVKVTGYTTDAARFCAITGGTYAANGNAGQADEQGTCTLKNGTQCDAASYYQGTCTASAEPTSAPTGSGLQAPSMEVCDGMAQVLAEALSRAVAKPSNFEVTQSQAPMTDPAKGASGAGCRASANGTGEQFSGPDVVIKAITAVLTGGGWTEDIKLQSGGPTGMGSGYRSRDLVAISSARWEPDASAKCPSDQPISACKVTPAQQLYTVTLDTAQEAAQGGAGAAPSIANPASQNCVKQGGKSVIETKPDGSQYGVCYFGDNLQCEEWALMRGECPVGGLKVTGYTTDAARFCAISGGKYAVTGNSNTAQEQGTCTLPSGKVCDAADYYNGKCTQ